MACLTTHSVLQTASYRMIWWLKGNRPGSVWRNISAFTWRKWGKQRKTRIAGVRSDNWTRDLQNEKHKYHPLDPDVCNERNRVSLSACITSQGYNQTSIQLCEGVNTRAVQLQIIERPHCALGTYSQAALQYICVPQFTDTNVCPCNDVTCETQDTNENWTQVVQKHLWWAPFSGEGITC